MHNIIISSLSRQFALTAVWKVNATPARRPTCIVPPLSSTLCRCIISRCIICHVCQPASHHINFTQYEEGQASANRPPMHLPGCHARLPSYCLGPQQAKAGRHDAASVQTRPVALITAKGQSKRKPLTNPPHANSVHSHYNL